MKIKSLLIGMLACSAMVACTNEDVIDNGNEQQSGAKGKAYVVVKIMDGEGIGSRGIKGSPEFHLGTADEHAIKTADFYFYDEDGNYVTEAQLTPSGTPTQTEGQVSGDNIEFRTSAVLVLTNLNQQNYPKYVVAVLNKPQGFKLGATLNAAKENLLEQGLAGTTITEGTGETTKTYFVMSNSTYNGAATAVAANGHFATVIPSTAFLKETPKDEEITAKAVNIYVERLSAKVELTSEDEYNLGNDFNINGVAGKTLKAKILGWGLNATNRKSYVMKNVNESFTALGDLTWDAASNFRSYWAMSPNYNGGTYPTMFTGETEETEGTTLDENTYDLDYISWKNLGVAVGSNTYCAENTNTKAVLEEGNFHAKATEVLLKAQVVDANNAPVSLIRYDNTLYLEDGYLERLFVKVAPQIYRLDGNTQVFISSEDVAYELKDEGDGRISVKFTGAKEGTSYEWKKDVTSDETTTAQTIENLATELNNAFNSQFAKERSTDEADANYVLAYHYNDGMMYYNIPIEHLRTQATAGVYTNGAVDVEEGEYGVVRNHYYKITVNSISKLGAAVHDATEEIVPDADENVTYCVGATINILSWKVVNQGANL